MLNLTVPDDSVAECSFTGIDTRPKLTVREAMDRAAMIRISWSPGWLRKTAYAVARHGVRSGSS